MPSQLVKLALIDEAPYINSLNGVDGNGDPYPLETDLDIEVFSVFQEGAQDASRQVVSIEPNVINIENGIEFIESKTYAIDVVGLFDQSRRTKIKNWSKNRTPLYVSGYGLDGSILYGYGAITSVVGTGTNMSFRFRMQNEAKGGYDGSTTLHSSGFSYSPNGRSYWKWTANPSSVGSLPLWFNNHLVAGINQNTTGIANPGHSSNNPSPSLTGTTDEVASVAFASSRFQGTEWLRNLDPTDRAWDWSWMYFPFDGVNLYLTVDINTFEASSDGTIPKPYLRTYGDYYGTSDYTENVYVDIDSTGTYSVNLTTPVGTTVVRTLFNSRDGDIGWSNPRLTIGEVKPFIEFNT